MYSVHEKGTRHMASILDSKIQVVPTGGALGADIVGIDMRNISEADFEVLHHAWMQHLVLRIRGQKFDNAEHVAIATLFGDPGDSPLKRFTGNHWFDDFPQISVLTNVDLGKDKPKGSLGFGDLYWHTDMNYVEAPPLGTLLHAYEVPPSGGDTYFLNMYAAYEGLTASMKQRIDQLQLKHENVHSSSGKVRPGRQEPASGDVRDYPGVVHPLVRRIPETGRTCLYLGRRINAYLVGLPVEESEAILDELWAHAEQPKYVWTQQWQVDDFIMWDNRTTMHRRDAFDPDSRRLMHRLVVHAA
jgi:taurine dioxygenase